MIDAALELHHDDPEFGYRFIADELAANGVAASENRVHRLCRLARISSVHAPRRAAQRRPGPPVHDDLVERDFTASAANQLWLTDITEHPTLEGKLYLCAVKDVYSGRVVGYSMDSRMKSSLAVAAVRSAVARRGGVDGCVVHSDRGSQPGLNRSSQRRLVGVRVKDRELGEAPLQPTSLCAKLSAVGSLAFYARALPLRASPLTAGLASPDRDGG